MEELRKTLNPFPDPIRLMPPLPDLSALTQVPDLSSLVPQVPDLSSWVPQLPDLSSWVKRVVEAANQLAHALTVGQPPLRDAPLMESKPNPFLEAVYALQNNNITLLKAFTVNTLGLPVHDFHLVALALFDGGKLGLRADGSNGWRSARDPRAYLRATVRRLKIRAKQDQALFKGDATFVALEDATEFAHPGVEMLRWALEVRADVSRVVELENLGLSKDAQTVLAERANGLTRTEDGAERLGWTIQRLQRAWKELQRAMPELRAYLGDYLQ